jgi:hypothetical protein
MQPAKKGIRAAPHRYCYCSCSAGYSPSAAFATDPHHLYLPFSSIPQEKNRRGRELRALITIILKCPYFPQILDPGTAGLS